ncbi:MAG: O-antigen ligase family protein [Patescibacteria group bacterium]
MNLLIYLATFLIPFYFFRFSFGAVKTNIFEAAVLLAFAAVLTRVIRNRAGIRFSSLRFVLFLTTALVSVAVASDHYNALGIFKGWFLIPALYAWSVANGIGRANLSKLSYSLLLSTLLVSFWAILQRLGAVRLAAYQVGDSSFFQYLNPEHFRAFGPFESPNYLAMFLVPALFLSLPVFGLARNNRERLTLACIMVPVLIAIFLALSRAGLLALALTLALGALVFFSRQKALVANLPGQRLVPAAKVALALGLAATLVWVGLNTPLGRPLSDIDRSRLDIYNYSMALLRENWLFGLGLGGYEGAIAAATENDIGFRRYLLTYALHPHNLYLALWLNLGFWGLLAFFGLLGRFFRRARRQWGTAKWAAVLALVAILIHGFFDTTYFKNDLAALFWLALALIEVNNEPSAG